MNKLSHKKERYKKHGAQIRQKLRNIGGLNFKSKLEKTDTLPTVASFGLLLLKLNFKNFQTYLRLDVTKY